MRFVKKGKLSPRYIGPYRILRQIDRVSYDLKSPPEFEALHPIIHASMLRMYVGDPKSIVPTTDVQIIVELSYEEVNVSIVDRCKKISKEGYNICESMYRSRDVEELMWEVGEEIKFRYPHLLIHSSE